MAWRGLHISRAAYLSLDKGRIKLKNIEEEYEDEDNTPLFFPIEDVAWLILDNAHSTLSTRLISACMEAGTPIIFSDTRHHPCGMALPFHQHYAQTEVSRVQLSLSTPFKKRIWTQIVQAKIRNQSENLRLQQHPDASVLNAMSNTIHSGDPKNVEARAARYYWGKLFNDFTRSDDTDIRNAMLNYGYACVRAVIARAIVAVGFIPSVGLHHDGRFNPFNLVDDLIEPFRPIVDWAVVEQLRERDTNEKSLTLDDRRAMAAILTRDIILDEKQLSLLHASERMADSLRKAVQETNSKFLIFPKGW